MSIEQEIEGLGVATGDHSKFDPEHVWGGESFEWANWENAERYMSLEEYNTKQTEEANSFKTREAFMMVNGREPIMNENGVGSDELVMFFVNNGGNEYFRRRYFQYRKGVEEKEIVNYYKNKGWEKK